MALKAAEKAKILAEKRAEEAAAASNTSIIADLDPSFDPDQDYARFDQQTRFALWKCDITINAVVANKKYYSKVRNGTNPKNAALVDKGRRRVATYNSEIERLWEVRQDCLETAERELKQGGCKKKATLFDPALLYSSGEFHHPYFIVPFHSIINGSGMPEAVGLPLGMRPPCS